MSTPRRLRLALDRNFPTPLINAIRGYLPPEFCRAIGASESAAPARHSGGHPRSLDTLRRMSAPTKPIALDLVGSYARTRGGQIEVVLSAPEIDLSGVTGARFVQGGETASGAVRMATVGERTQAIVTVDRARLTNGQWKVALVDLAATHLVDARLLVQPENRPVVLLWGANTPPSIVPKRAVVRPLTPKQQRAHAAGKVVDRALSVLPAQRAKQVRSTVRSVARRVLR